MRAKYIQQTGVVNEINFDGRFAVDGYKGIAFYLLGFAAHEVENTDGEYELEMDEDQVVAVMVGDDRRHIVHISDIKEIAEDSYCPSCGQIGCGHGRV